MESSGSERYRRWFNSADVWAGFLLIVAWFFFFSDVLFSSKNFYFRDILNFHYPLRKVLIQAYARGEFPLWNPFIYLGQPMLANPNYMAFYPTNLLHFFFSFNYAFKLHFILHPLLGGLGIYFLQRRLGIGAMAAFGGSLVYQFSGTVLSFLNLYNIVPAVGLLPWVGWAFVGALMGDWVRRGLVFGALLGVQILAFEPLMFQCNVWLIVGLAIYYLLEVEDRVKAAGKILRVGVVGALLAVSLGAVQVLPAIELIPRTGRGAGYDFKIFSNNSLHPADLVNTVVPNLFGNFYTINHTTYWGEAYHGLRGPYLVSYFLGTGTILLILLSILSSRKKLQKTLGILTLFSVALALGRFNPVYHWLYENIPVFRLGRYPSKYFLLGTLTLTILTSLGLEVILNSAEVSSRKRRLILVAASFGLTLGLAFVGTWVFLQSYPEGLEQFLRSKVDPAVTASKDFPDIHSQMMQSVRFSGIFLLISSVLVFISLFWRRRTLMGGLLILALGAELIPANSGLSPLISDADMDFVPEVNAYLQKYGPGGPYRVVSPTLLRPTRGLQMRAPNRSSAWVTFFYRMSGQPMDGIMNGIQYSLDLSVDDLNTRESEELWRSCLQLPQGVGLTLMEKLNSPVILALGEMQEPRLRLRASFDTMSNLKLNLYWLDNTLSRAYFVSGVEEASSPGEALDKFLRSEFPFADTVIIEDSRIAKRPGQSGAGVARILLYQNRRVLCQVDARTSGCLVLLDSYYPGWRAYLDGNEVQILKANYAFRAVQVMPGKHQVEFRYEPRAFFFGLGISSLALIILAVSPFWR